MFGMPTSCRAYGCTEQYNKESNTFALLPGAKTWRQQLHDEPLPRVNVGILFCYYDGHGHLWTITTDCDHHNWPVLTLCVTIYDHLWWTNNDDHLFTQLCSRRVVMCLVVVYVRSFVHSLIPSFPHTTAGI